ncbi:hypothetical protein ACLESO_05955 [Pyxidicoccus sp. 3LG]
MDFDWLFKQRWGEDTPHAVSIVLGAIYEIAYGRVGGLGNDAEYPLCLAYAALAIRHLAQRMGPVLLGDAVERVLHVGFDSGDFFCIGAVRQSGLVFSRSHSVMR